MSSLFPHRAWRRGWRSRSASKSSNPRTIRNTNTSRFLLRVPMFGADISRLPHPGSIGHQGTLMCSFSFFYFARHFGLLEMCKAGRSGVKMVDSCGYLSSSWCLFLFFLPSFALRRGTLSSPLPSCQSFNLQSVLRHVCRTISYQVWRRWDVHGLSTCGGAVPGGTEPQRAHLTGLLCWVVRTLAPPTNVCSYLYICMCMWSMCTL